MSKSSAAENDRSVKLFQPLASMEKWLDTQIELLSSKTVDISRECNISRQSWYMWTKIPGFTKWYYEEYDKRLVNIRPRLDAIGMKFSEKGSYNHWKDMQRFAGRAETPASVNNFQIPIFNVMTTEAKKELTNLYEGSDSSNS